MTSTPPPTVLSIAGSDPSGVPVGVLQAVRARAVARAVHIRGRIVAHGSRVPAGRAGRAPDVQ